MIEITSTKFEREKHSELLEFLEGYLVATRLQGNLPTCRIERDTNLISETLPAHFVNVFYHDTRINRHKFFSIKLYDQSPRGIFYIQIPTFDENFNPHKIGKLLKHNGFQWIKKKSQTQHLYRVDLDGIPRKQLEELFVVFANYI